MDIWMRSDSHGAHMAGRKKPKSSSSRRKVAKPPPDASTWPLLRAYGPWRDCWAATACGSAGVLREAPDGRVAAAVFAIELIHGGLQAAGSALLASAEEAEDYLNKLRHLMPPMAPASLEEAANFVWAARALAESHDAFSDQLQLELSMLPERRETPEELIAWLLHSVTPERLSDICQRNFNPNIAPGQEAMCITRMTFVIPDADAAIASLRGADPAFTETEEQSFVWTRKYPKGHWSPMANSGNRQIIGSVRLRGGRLVGEVNALTMGWVLATTLQDMIPEVQIAEAEWKDLTAMTKDLKGR